MPINISKDNTSFALFHDESECDISNFLYHGFLFVRTNCLIELIQKLRDIKIKYHRELSEIHFNKITSRDKKNIVIEWLSIVKSYMCNDIMKFYCLGVNRSNIKDFWNNGKSYDDNIYSKFFEIGLKGSIRFYKIKKVSHIYCDNGVFNIQREAKVRKIYYDFLLNYKMNEIDITNIEMLDSDEKISKNQLSILIQLTDVLLGVCRSSFIEINPKNKDKIDCVNQFIEVIERFNCSLAYNKNGRYFSKFSIQFFPTSNNINKDQFLERGADYFLNGGHFYNNRKTYRQEISEKIKNESNYKLF